MMTCYKSLSSILQDVDGGDDVDYGGSDAAAASSGIITATDLQGTALARDLNLVLSPQCRFLMKNMPFRQDAQSLLQAWNLFQTGQLGLRYTEEDKTFDDDDDGDDDDTDKSIGKKKFRLACDS